MDKYEYRVSLDEIDRLIEERHFKEAAAIADKIDWKNVRGTFTLCRISDLYKINRRYEDSLELLEIAYERKPSSRKIIYSLCELELKLDHYIHALSCTTPLSMWHPEIRTAFFFNTNYIKSRT